MGGKQKKQHAAQQQSVTETEQNSKRSMQRQQLIIIPGTIINITVVLITYDHKLFFVAPFQSTLKFISGPRD